MSWTKSYIFSGDSLLSTFTKNGTAETLEFHHPDRLGTKLVTNNTANTSFEQSSLPFGTALEAESSGTNTTNRKFTSYNRSSVTKLDYAVNRSYSTGQGRFTQVDPIGMSSTSLIAPQTLNLYSYCGNDPVNRTDPSGLFWGFFKKLFKWAMIALAVVVAVMTIVAAPATIAGILGAISAGAGAASAVLNGLGFKTAGMIFGIVALATGFGSILAAQSKKGLIYTLEEMAIEQGKKNARLAAKVGIGLGVGAIVNYFHQTDRPRKKAREARRLLAILDAAQALLNTDCANYIRTGVDVHPEEPRSRLLNNIDNILDRSSINPSKGDDILARNVGGSRVGKLKIKLFGGFYDDKLLAKYGDPRKLRALIILHELKHSQGGGTHDLPGNESKVWNDTILSKCLRNL